MKKLISILLVALISISLISCGSKKDTAASTQTEISTKDKIYKAGEEAFITDDKGNKMYSLKINSVKTANDFEYKNEFSTAKQIIEVNYTYNNISKSDSDLCIYSQNLQVIDSSNSVAEDSSMYPKLKPQKIGTGANCTVDGYFGLSHESSKVKVSFTSSQYKKTLIFEIDVQ